MFNKRTNFFDPWETKNKSNAWKKLLNQSTSLRGIKENVLPTIKSIKEAIRKTEEEERERNLSRFRMVEQLQQPETRNRFTLPVPGSPEFEPEGRLPSITRAPVAISPEPKRILPSITNIQEKSRFEQAREAELTRQERKKTKKSRAKGMRQLREIEQEQQPGIPPNRRVYSSGVQGSFLTPSFIEMEAYDTGTIFEPGTGTRLYPKPVEVAQHLFFTKFNDLINSGVSPEEAVKQVVDDPILSTEQRDTIDRIYTNYTESQQAEYMPGTADLSTSQTAIEKEYASITTGEESITAGLLKPIIPEAALEFVGTTPLIGTALENELRFVSSPIGLLALAQWPVMVGVSGAGGIVAATAVQELGGSEEQQLYAQIAGNILTPGGGLVSSKFVTAPARAAANKAVRGVELATKETSLLRKVASDMKKAWELEAGGGKLSFGAEADNILAKFDTGQVVNRSEITKVVEQEGVVAGTTIRGRVLGKEANQILETTLRGAFIRGKDAIRVALEEGLSTAAKPTKNQALAFLRNKHKALKFGFTDEAANIIGHKQAGLPGAAISKDHLIAVATANKIPISKTALKEKRGVYRLINNTYESMQSSIPKTSDELTDGELLAKLRDKEKQVASTVEESTEDIAQRIENKVPPSSHKEATSYREAADPSGTSPRKPPPETKAISPDDPEFDDIWKLALKGEPVPETLIRRHDGAVRNTIAASRNAANAVNELLRKSGLARVFHGSTVAKEEDGFLELYSLLHNRSRVASGELIVPKNLREAFDELVSGINWEQAMRVDFDPNMSLIEDYVYRGWKPPDEAFTRKHYGVSFGRNPDFKFPRVNATFDEMIEAGFRPLFENPAEQLHYSNQIGIKFREQRKLLEQLKTRELAKPVIDSTIPEGWRVPEIGPSFEGKPFTSAEGQYFTTQRYAVSDSLANRLENVYGVISKHWGKGRVLGKDIDLQQIINTAVFLPKRAKLIGSVFQHVDFLSRSGIGAWTGFIDALRHGEPIESVYHLLKLPKAVMDIASVAFRPGFRSRLARISEDSTPLFRNRKLSPKMISEAGLGTFDPTIFPKLDEVLNSVRREGKLLKWGKAPFRLLNDLERFWREGLFQGVYPAAIWADVKNNIAPAILRQHPNATDEQLAGLIAKAANTSYSSIPIATSVIQNKQARWFLTRFLFSLGENEGLLRAFTGAVKGENAAYFRTRLLGLYLSMVATANVIHFASTGKPLPIDRWTPISKDNWGPLPLSYNRDFAAPTIPLTGRSGAEITLDLMGQMDTTLRILDPSSFLNARVSVPARATLNQSKGTDFFGAPIDTVGPGGVFSRASQLAQDLFAPIGVGQAGLEILRKNINQTQGLIQPGEGRLGTTGLGIQAGGVNIRAEQTGEFINRIQNEVIQDMGIDTVKVDTDYAEFTGIEDTSTLEKIKEGDIVGVFEGEPSTYEKLDALQKGEVDDEVEKRIGSELEIREETAKIRGQDTVEGQFYDEMEILRVEQRAAQLASDYKFKTDQWDGDVWRKDLADRLQEYYFRRDEHREALKVEFKDRPNTNKIDKAVEAYFEINLDDEKYKNDDGTYKWEEFFGDQENALRSLSFSDRKRVMDEIIHKYDTPTITKFRETKKALKEFYDTSRFYGFSVEMSDAIVALTDPNGPILGEYRAGQINKITSPSDYFDILMNFAVELHAEKDFEGADIAFYAAYKTRESEARDLMNKLLDQGNTKEAARMAGLIEGNPERDKLLMNNLELLKFYPKLKDQLSEKERASLSAEEEPLVEKDRLGFTEFVATLPEIFQRGQYGSRSAETEVINRAKIRGTDYGVPKYRDLSLEQGRQVDELLDEITISTRKARDSGRRNVPSKREVLSRMLKSMSKDDPLYPIVATAFISTTDAKDSVRTPESLVDTASLMNIYREEQDLQEILDAAKE